MKNILQKWRGLTAAALLAVTTLPAAETPLVKTLGGGPNQTSNDRAGSADGGTFSFAKFKKPYAAALGTNGDLFIADFGNGKVRRVTKPGSPDSVTSTFASGLASPSGVAIDSNAVYVVSQGDGKLRKFSSTGTLLETVGGFRAPTAVAINSTGTVFIAELGGNIYQVLSNDAPMLIASGLRRPRGIAVLGNGLLAVTESSGHAVQLVDPNTGVATLIAGGNGAGFADGSVAKFNQPYGIALAPNGSLIVADKANHRVRVIGSNNVVSTLYGVPRSQWVSPFPGWVDGPGGPNGTAASRDPVGVVVSSAGAVFTTEIYWNLLRQVTGIGLTISNSAGVVTNIIYEGTNAIVVVGTNVVSFGFESGEASSVFVAAAGQKFYAPVTLANAPGQNVYTFQMSLSATGETGLAIAPSSLHFVSMVDRQDKVITRDPTIPFDLPQVFTTNILYTPITNNIMFRNDSINMLGVGWLTRYEKTNLYNTLAQDLITYSIAKNTLLGRDQGKVVLGAYGVQIPANATASDSFLIAISNPSGTADGISRPVQLSVPTTGSFSNGTPNTIKRLTMGSRLYLVGDNTPFRWFNAGDFGDTNLANSDVIDLFQTAVYDLNKAIEDSDLFNAMDSSDGSLITSVSDLFNGDSFYTAALIDSITTGDGTLNLDDVFVTFRRALDPTLKWYARYWSNGALQVVEVPNTLAGGAGSISGAALAKTTKAKSLVARPTLAVTVDNALATPGSTLQLPIRVEMGLAYPLRTMMLNVTVQALDGSPAITDTVQMQLAPTFGAPDISDSRGANNLAGAWLDNQITGISGNSMLAILTVHVPAGAGTRAAYRVHFDHFSGSPNGTALFDSRTHSGLILLSDRSASTWNDGISDEWRLRYFGSIYAQDSAVGADADGDGVVNSIEYQNGTNPTDATSF